MTDSLNRRQSVRVTDRVMLAIHPVSAEKMQGVAKDFQQGISPYNQEGLADIQMFIGAQSALAKLRERDADLADFLQHLDNKMNIMLKQAKGGESPLDALIMRKANISANGIAFYTDSPARLDEIVEIHVVLLPAYTYVYSFGKVIACDPVTAEDESDCKFRVALEFVFLLEEDREKIIQHTFRQQSLALRNRRINP
ncbi:PilZ domain-containing protein [Thiovibrio frasassiensis]|uniref:PilZ domain-containing protein n=1 Tax=Thiovibrio frasassiensis TaxID=2984131 RepID=A0A9X4RMR0_9BACT|nr:PilZ domain-containing protein [Thiovibrio frasassiensis]MDG4477039.1 PilZ domain-containing protein [Thiovibrio frasassiensis]